MVMVLRDSVITYTWRVIVSQNEILGREINGSKGQSIILTENVACRNYDGKIWF